MNHFILFLIGLLFFSSHSLNDLDKNMSVISIPEYKDQLKGFWLGQCIANMTGLVTEMDKIGNIGEIKTGKFYTSNDWGKLDEPNIFSPNQISEYSETIDFVFEQDGVWPADDDTDIEYMYQDLLLKNKTSFLTPTQIRSGWMKHIKIEEENFLWVSNQKAFDLMKEGVIILNSSRGALINEDALVRFIKNKKVSSAWLDVFDKEPYNGELTQFNQVLLTPHMSTYSEKCRKDMEMMAVKNLLNDLGLEF